MKTLKHSDTKTRFSSAKQRAASFMRKRLKVVGASQVDMLEEILAEQGEKIKMQHREIHALEYKIADFTQGSWNLLNMINSGTLKGTEKELLTTLTREIFLKKRGAVSVLRDFLSKS